MLLFILIKTYKCYTINGDNMIKVLFVCHGNICRSTMAEFVFKQCIKLLNIEDKFYVESAGTSNEEEGNPVHNGTKKILDKLGIDCSLKRARQIKKSDYEKFDYIIGMDRFNKSNLYRFFNGDKDNKISLLLDFTPTPRDVIDPWYYDNFEETYDDILYGIKHFLKKLNIQ